MKFLYTLLVIYIIYRLFYNFLLPLAARYFFQKVAKNMNGQFGYQQQQQTHARRQGEVRIEDPVKSPSGNRNYNAGDVEDVDYVEVK
jgi:hypothetical protein